MPNGFRDIMRVFNKILEPPWGYLRERGLFSVAYLDDTLLGSDTFLECKHKVTPILTYLADLGFFIHPDKSIFHSHTQPKHSILFEAAPNRILYYRNIESDKILALKQNKENFKTA